MRALVFSDSHGMGDEILWLLEDAWKRTGNQPIDWYIHCGDGLSDFERLKEYAVRHDPHANFCAVRGNCDFGWSDYPATAQITIGGVQVFVTHGHHYHVKSGLMNLDYAAEERGCSIALYGHTHVANMETGRALLLNPGSAADSRVALLEITAGVPHATLLRL